jgi:WD40 repeat protein
MVAQAVVGCSIGLWCACAVCAGCESKLAASLPYAGNRQVRAASYCLAEDKVPSLSPLASASLPNDIHLVRRLVLSPNDEFIAWMEDDLAEPIARRHKTRVWSFRKRRQVCELLLADVTTIAFSPSGRTLALSAFDGAIQLWDTATWKRKAVLGDTKRIEHTASAMAFAHQKRLLAAGFFRKGFDPPDELRLWDLVASRVQLLGTVDRFPDYLSFSPNDRYLAVASWADGLLTIWDVARCKKEWAFHPHTDPLTDRGSIHGLGFLADGRTLVTAGTDRMIRIWDIKAKKPVRHFDGMVGEIEVMALSPDGKTVAVGRDAAWEDPLASEVRLWNTTTGKQVGATKRLPNGVSCMCFSQDGKYLAVGSYEADGRKGKIELWPVGK